jgi:hypothetical protein
MTSSQAQALAALIRRDCPQVDAAYRYNEGDPYVLVVWNDPTNTECRRIVHSEADWWLVKRHEVLPGITLYLEPDGKNVFAAFTDNPRCPDGSVEGLGAVFSYANSPVAGTAASPDYLAKCRVVSAHAAWYIHPNLMNRLAEVEYGEERDDDDDRRVRHTLPAHQSRVHRGER